MLGELGQLLRAIAAGPDPAKIPPPTEVIPVLPTSEYQPSFQYPAGIYPFIGYAIEGAGANRSHVAILNPSGSGVCATVRCIDGYTTTNSVVATIASAAAVSAFDNDGAEGVRDTRLRVSTGVTRSAACRIISDDTTQKGDVIARLIPNTYDTAGYFYHYRNHPLVLFPGAALCCMPSADSIALTWTFTWEERRYDQEELRGVHAGIIT